MIHIGGLWKRTCCIRCDFYLASVVATFFHYETGAPLNQPIALCNHCFKPYLECANTSYDSIRLAVEFLPYPFNLPARYARQAL